MLSDVRLVMTVDVLELCLQYIIFVAEQRLKDLQLALANIKKRTIGKQYLISSFESAIRIKLLPN